MKNILILNLISILFTVSCNFNQKSSGGANQQGEKYYPGDLIKKFEEIYSQENEILFEACDYTNKYKIIEIAKALSIKNEEILKLYKKRAENNVTSKFYLGQYQFHTREVPKDVPNEWKTETFSWSEIFSFYDQIKSSSNIEKWATLNRWVRGIIFDDEARLTYGEFMGIKKDSEPLLRKIKDQIDQCVASSICTEIALSPQQDSFLRVSKIYDQFLNLLNKSDSSNEKKRETVIKFARWINSDLRRFVFSINPLLTVEGKVLKVPMDLSILDQSDFGFINLIESRWSLENEYRIKILSVKPPIPSFLLKIDVNPGGRAYVSRTEKLMQLYNYGYDSTIIHEFGHIIGLNDSYFTSWDAQSCTYMDEFNPGDIMSSSSSGKILPEHWTTIKENYWSK